MSLVKLEVITDDDDEQRVGQPLPDVIELVPDLLPSDDDQPLKVLEDTGLSGINDRGNLDELVKIKEFGGAVAGMCVQAAECK